LFPKEFGEMCLGGVCRLVELFVTFDVAETQARFKFRVCGQEILQEEKKKKKKKKKATSRQTVRQSARARTHYA